LQIIMALYTAYDRFKFTHYDLHTDNIHIIKCSKNLIFTYYINKEYFHVHTHGYIPVIIDYEYAYVNKLSDMPTQTNVRNIDAGFYKIVPCPFTDLMVFLCNVSHDMVSDELDDTSSESEIEIPIDECDDVDELTCELLDSEYDIGAKVDSKYNKFRNAIESAFAELPINLNSGIRTYDESVDFPLAMFSMFEGKIRKYNSYDQNKLFESNFTDIIQELLILHKANEAKKVSSAVAEKALRVFMKEFHKIQSQTTNRKLAFALFQTLINVMRVIKDKYIRNRKDKYIKYIECEFLHRVDKICTFVRPQGVNYEHALISAIMLSRYLSHKIFKHVVEMQSEIAEKASDIALLNFKKSFCLIKSEYQKRCMITPKSIVVAWGHAKPSAVKMDVIIKPIGKRYSVINKMQEGKLSKVLYNCALKWV